MINSLHILTVDGRPVYHNNLSGHMDNIEDATLFSGMISAIQGFMKEINVGSIKSFETEKNRIYVSNQEDLAYVLMIDIKENYSRKDIEQLFSLLHEQVKHQFNSDMDLVITRDEYDLLDRVVESKIHQWGEERTKSKAAKKLQDELW